MDIKRTVLWVVFSLSILLLWDNWMRASGKPSMFFPTANQQAKGPASAADAAKSDLPQASASSGTPASAATTGAVSTDTTPVKGETIAISTDLVKAEISTAGGELTHLELLKHRGTVDQKSNLVLFDNSPNRTYLAETGLIGGANGAAFPDHKTLFVAKPGPRTLDGNNEVKL